MVASRVQPDDVQIRLRGPHGPVVLSAIKLDEEFLERFAGRFLLDNVGFVMGHNKPQDGRGAAGFNGPDGKPVGWVTWLPQNPGAHLLRRLLPWLSALGIVVIVLVSRLVQSSRNIAQGLITSEARAAHLAFHDPLTGLANRVQFADRLSQALTRLRRGNKPLAVLCIDLDRFKEVNDSFGHGVGDELLKDGTSLLTAAQAAKRGAATLEEAYAAALALLCLAIIGPSTMKAPIERIITTCPTEKLATSHLPMASLSANMKSPPSISTSGKVTESPTSPGSCPTRTGRPSASRG